MVHTIKKTLSIVRVLEHEQHTELNQEAVLASLDEKQQKYKKVLETLSLLEKLFPECFNATNPKPLKEHIAEDIFKLPNIMQGISKAVVRNAIRIYVHKGKYLEAIINDSRRYNLQGEECGDVRPSHKIYALEQLDKKAKKLQKSRKDKKR